MTTDKSDNGLASNFPPDDTTPNTRKGPEEPGREVNVPRAPTSQIEPAFTQLSKQDFKHIYDLDQVIVGMKERYELVCPIRDPIRAPSRAVLIYARGIDSGQEVIVKQFPEIGQDQFEREKILQGILRFWGGHKNIQLADEFLDEQRMVITPYARGGDLDHWQNQTKIWLTPRQAKGIICGLCDALQYLHNCSIVHRDVKNKNIVLDIASPALKKITAEQLTSPEITPKLFDYDVGGHKAVAHLEVPQSIRGTYHYMAPEVIKGGKLDPRVDIYAAGIVLYKLLTRNFPFVGNKASEIMESHFRVPVPDVTEFNPAVTAGVQSVLEKALAKDPDDRYQTAAELKWDYLEKVR